MVIFPQIPTSFIHPLLDKYRTSSPCLLPVICSRIPTAVVDPSSCPSSSTPTRASVIPLPLLPFKSSTFSLIWDRSRSPFALECREAVEKVRPNQSPDRVQNTCIFLCKTWGDCSIAMCEPSMNIAGKHQKNIRKLISRWEFFDELILIDIPRRIRRSIPRSSQRRILSYKLPGSKYSSFLKRCAKPP